MRSDFTLRLEELKKPMIVVLDLSFDVDISSTRYNKRQDSRQGLFSPNNRIGFLLEGFQIKKKFAEAKSQQHRHCTI